MIKLVIVIISIFIGQIIFIYHAFSLVTIYAAENPPLSIKNKDDTIGGIGGEILNAAIINANIKVTVEWVPWLRAIETVARNPNTILFPIGENRLNKERFNFIGELYSDDVYIFTLKPNKPISDIKDIPNLGAVGMVAGSPYIDIAIKYGFDRKLETSYNGERTIDKLKLNRVEGVIFTKLIGIYKLEKAGISKTIYQQGISIGKIGWFIATNKKTNNTEVNKLSEALRKFRESEKYQKILNKYFSKYK